jgi:hypothetical protein
MHMVIARFLKLPLQLIVFAMFTAALLPAQSGAAAFERIPQPDPPTIEKEIPEAPSAKAAADFMAPSATTEWTYHKTNDNLHPDGNEQQMLWLLNRARSDPAQEGVWLATVTDPDIAAARTYWGVNVTALQNDFAAIPAQPPAAFDVRLYNAAKAHSDYLISIDSQTHDGQFNRIDAAGFEYTSAAGIVFSYSENALYGHAGFNIDWGPGPNGMQNPPGHRNAIMSVSGNYTNVGYAVVAESNPTTQVGPQVITGDLCYADTGFANHYNRFLVGTVWVDSNGNDQYDPGEGIGGVTVNPDQGTYYAVTANGGGYAIPITAAGTYVVTFSGSSITAPVTRTATVGSTSLLLDLKYAGDNTVPEANTASATSVGSSSAILHGTVIPNGSSTTYYFQYGTTTGYGSQSTSRATGIDLSVAETVTGLSDNTTYHFRLVATNASGTSSGPDRTFQTTAASSSSSGGGGGGGGGPCLISTAGNGAEWGAADGWLLAGLLAACLTAVYGRTFRQVALKKLARTRGAHPAR